jgi:hypothetical protein
VCQQTRPEQATAAEALTADTPNSEAGIWFTGVRR